METTEVKELSVIDSALQQANVTEQVILKLKTDYMGLTIEGLEDKAGFKKVEDARKECKAIRVLATKICKTGREEAISIQKQWIEKEKEVCFQIAEVENHLEAQSEAIKELEKKILFEAAQAAKLPHRKEKLATIGIEVEDSELLKINDDQFNALFNEFHEKHLAEKAAAIKAEEDKIRSEKLEAKRKENDRLAEEKRQKDLVDAAEKAKQEAERKAKEAIAKAEQEKKDAELRAIHAEEKAKAEAAQALLQAERDKSAAIAKLKAEQEAKEAAELKARQDAEIKAKAEKEAAIEAELSKGDKAKFETIIADLAAIKTKYEFKSKKHNSLSVQVNGLIDKIINHIKEKS